MTYPHVDTEHEQLTDAELDARAEAVWHEFIAPCGSWEDTVARCREYATKSEAGPSRKWKKDREGGKA